MAEIVNATIIGRFTWLYEFWTPDGKRQVGKRGVFGSDDEAEAWFREHYPVEYRAGVEMRRYN